MPRWVGLVWVLGTVIFYLLGAALGMATTGASLITQPIGAGLLTVSGAVLARQAYRRPTTGGTQSAPSPMTTTPRS